jgi:Ca2+-transporting ATPase
MEQAFHRCANTSSPAWINQHQAWKLVHEYALTPAILAITHVWQVTGSEQAVVAAKGAPETMIRLCRLAPDQAAREMAQVEQLALQGLRVLAVARASHRGAWPSQPDAFAFEWLGLIGLADPLRPGAAAAVAQCRRAGLRVVMITGDYPLTAQAIARDAGLDASRIITGAQIDAAGAGVKGATGNCGDDGGWR